MIMKRKLCSITNWKLCGFCLLLAAYMLFFCTKSSPAYPINDWCDANIYLSIGKGMKNGAVLYRDLYDHKGPLLYVLHMVCAFVSENSFLGVYILEVVCAAWFLLECAEILKRFGVQKLLWPALFILAYCCYACYSFSEGDSAEELCMPLCAACLRRTLIYIDSEKDKAVTKKCCRQLGFYTGCLFWIKFTIIGIPVGCMICVLLDRSSRKQKIPMRIAQIVEGFIASTLPWLVYFGICHALPDLWEVYFIHNFSLYNEKQDLIERIKLLLTYGYGWTIQNPLYSLLVYFGLAGVLLREHRRYALCFWSAAAFGAFCVFIGIKSYPYYGQALAPLAVGGGAVLLQKLENVLQAKRSRILVSALLCICCTVLCPLTARNMREGDGVQFLQKASDTPQYKLAAYIPQDGTATLLNYGFMDMGLFTAADIVPNTRFFNRCNVPLAEIDVEQRRYLQERITDYVVTCGAVCDELNENYELIYSCEAPGQWYPMVYLYTAKTL